MLKKIYKILIVISVLYMAANAASAAFAANEDIALRSSTNTIKPNDIVYFTVQLNQKGHTITGFNHYIYYDEDIFEVVDLNASDARVVKDLVDGEWDVEMDKARDPVGDATYLTVSKSGFYAPPLFDHEGYGKVTALDVYQFALKVKKTSANTSLVFVADGRRNTHGETGIPEYHNTSNNIDDVIGDLDVSDPPFGEVLLTIDNKESSESSINVTDNGEIVSHYNESGAEQGVEENNDNIYQDTDGESNADLLNQETPVKKDDKDYQNKEELSEQVQSGEEDFLDNESSLEEKQEFNSNSAPPVDSDDSVFIDMDQQKADSLPVNGGVAGEDIKNNDEESQQTNSTASRKNDDSTKQKNINFTNKTTLILSLTALLLFVIAALLVYFKFFKQKE